MKISVIICTHNPNLAYLERALGALKRQALDIKQWELILIDNKSDRPLAEMVDLSWHSGARVVREENLGLTQARLRGIRESRGDLLVFVDDDNVLREDFLESAIRIEENWPCLGAWSGRVVPEYEAQPDAELTPYLWLLCIRDVQEARWGNTGAMEISPWGAGMCVRRDVALAYERDCQEDVRKSLLDRRGEGLGSSGDIDLALTSLHLGLGTGVFPDLEVLHLISARRVRLDYLERLIEDSTAIGVVFEMCQRKRPTLQKSKIDQLVEKYKYLRANATQKAVAKAIERGLKRGKNLAESCEGKIVSGEMTN